MIKSNLTYLERKNLNIITKYIITEMTENPEHYNALHKFCRVCGSKLAKGKTTTKYNCSKFKADLKATFSIDTAVDDPYVHPSHFCHACKLVVYHTKKAESEKRYANLTKRIHTWEVHTPENCEVCNPPQAKQGRPKKVSTGGRPPTASVHSAIKHVRQIAPPTFVNMQRTLDTDIHSDFLCKLCSTILNQPIELSDCGNYVCSKCLCDSLKESNSLTCPCCSSDHIKNFQDAIKRPPDIVLTALSNLQITCSLCNRKGYLKDQEAHLSSNCLEHFNGPQFIAEILDKPKESPLSPTECKLQSSLLRRCLTTSGSSGTIPTVKVKTGGQVSSIRCMMNITHCTL